MENNHIHLRIPRRRRIRPLIKRLAIYALYWSGLLWAYAIVKLRGRGVALMYHRVLPEEKGHNSYSASAIQVTNETFDRHVRYLKRHFNPLSASQLVEHLTAGRQLPDRSVIITFDDGWQDNAEYAAPTLARYNVPAVIFVATDYVGQLGGFWQEQLSRLLYIAHDNGLLQQVTLEELRLSVADGMDDTEVRLAIRCIVDWIKINEPAAALDILGQVHRFLLKKMPNREPDDCGEDRFLTWQDLRVLCESPVVEFGSHSCSHTPLTQLAESDVVDELQESKSVLEARLSQPIRCFAYPNGNVSDTVVAQVRGAGYDLAFTTRYGLIGPGEPLHSLGRVSIHEEAADSYPMLMARIVGLI